MAQQSYDYIIVGAGLTGASAVEGIRERDAQGTILLVGAEPQRPYNRPPLSKQLWTGKETLETIFVHKAEFYEQQRVTLLLNTEIASLDAGAKAVVDRNGQRYQYGKLLLATSGHPRTLSIPGGDLDGISYFRTYESYVRLRKRCRQRQVGGRHRRRIHRIGACRRAEHDRARSDHDFSRAVSGQPSVSRSRSDVRFRRIMSIGASASSTATGPFRFRATGNDLLSALRMALSSTPTC